MKDQNLIECLSHLNIAAECAMLVNADLRNVHTEEARAWAINLSGRIGRLQDEVARVLAGAAVLPEPEVRPVVVNVRCGGSLPLATESEVAAAVSKVLRRASAQAPSGREVAE